MGVGVDVHTYALITVRHFRGAIPALSIGDALFVVPIPDSVDTGLTWTGCGYVSVRGYVVGVAPPRVVWTWACSCLQGPEYR